MTNEEMEKSLKEALRQLAYQATPVWLENSSCLLPAPRTQQLTGRWEGKARHTIQNGTILSVPAEREQSIVATNDLSAIIGMRFTFESSGNDEFSGDGELDIDLSHLNREFIKSVYVDIKGEVLKDGRYVFEAQDIEDEGCRVHFTATLSEDGNGLSGTYQAVGLLTNEAVAGAFNLEKLREVRQGYEVITVEPMRQIIDLIRRARHFVLATHFTSDIPPEEYISAMVERLHEEVPITRIVALHPDAPKERYRWMNCFRNPEGKTLQYYTEYKFSSIPLPADILVIDDEVAVQGFVAFPEAKTYSFAICYYDPQVARFFRESIEALKSNLLQEQETVHFY